MTRLGAGPVFPMRDMSAIQRGPGEKVLPRGSVQGPYPDQVRPDEDL